MTFEKEFVWRGLPFVWNGRRRLWICEQPHDQCDWWVTQHWYWTSWARREFEEVNWQVPPGPPDSRVGFKNDSWMAHFGFGDAAERPTRDQALEAALGYALGFHHARLAQLRSVLYTPTEAPKSICGPNDAQRFCSYPLNHEGCHSWEVAL